VIRIVEPTELPALSKLARASFEAQLAPQFSEAGREEYLRFTTPEAMAARAAAGHQFLASRLGEHWIVMAEVRESTHLVMLFVAPDFLGAGYGSGMLARVLAMGVETVNAAPPARGFYERAGFAAQGEEQEKNGIRFVPMRWKGER